MPAQSHPNPGHQHYCGKRARPRDRTSDQADQGERERHSEHTAF